MDEIKVGEEYWTWVNGTNPIRDMPTVKKIKVREIFTYTVTGDVVNSWGTAEIPKDSLFESQNDAMQDLQKKMDEIKK